MGPNGQLRGVRGTTVLLVPQTHREWAQSFGWALQEGMPTDPAVTAPTSIDEAAGPAVGAPPAKPKRKRGRPRGSKTRRGRGAKE